MNTVVTLNLAGPAQQAGTAIVPAAKPAPAAAAGTASRDAANAHGFATELQASAELLPDVVDVLAEQMLAEQVLVEPGAVESTQVGSEGEAGLEQIEAVLGSLLAQQQQQVQAQPATPQGEVSAGGAAQSLPGLPSDRLTQAHAVEGKAPVLPVQGDVRGETGAARAEVAPLTVGSAIGTLAAGLATEGETSAAPSGQANQLPTAITALPERTLKLQGSDAQRGEQMLHALRDSVDMQIQQKAQRATIRLDPPELGKLEIVVSQEAGRINIQIHAGQADTLRLLQQTSDRLRQELLTQHFVQVNVQVGADSQSGQQSRQEQLRYTENVVRDNVLQPSGDDTRHRDTSDVLVTV